MSCIIDNLPLPLATETESIILTQGREELRADNGTVVTRTKHPAHSRQALIWMIEMRYTYLLVANVSSCIIVEQDDATLRIQSIHRCSVCRAVFAALGSHLRL